jgi:DNA-binding transcriptional MerR regulator
MRMAELSRKSGVARETIHYYLREGLLPRPRKGGRTVAYYDDEHLERLLLIRRLREEKYLPLAVIRRLLDTQAASAERDVDTLAEVLHIDPTFGRVDEQAAASEAAMERAVSLGLLGPPREGGMATPEGAGIDTAESRVLAIVDEVLALDADAQALTFRDLEVCARDISGLVDREAELFFDMVLQKADIATAVQALRRGRSAVARFIGAYRDLLLRRIVEDLLLAVQHGPVVIASSSAVLLSSKKARELGSFTMRAALGERLEIASSRAGAARELVWHLYGLGAVQELAALPADVQDALDPQSSVLFAWGAYEATHTLPALTQLQKAADRVPDFALGQILLGEAILTRGVRRLDVSGSFLEGAIPALHRLVAADLAVEPSPAVRAFALFHRARVDVTLPRVLGRQERGAAELASALALVDDPRNEGSFDPAARVRLGINLRLTLGRYRASLGDAAHARRLLEQAMQLDPEGPIAAIVREQLATQSMMGAAAAPREGVS